MLHMWIPLLALASVCASISLDTGRIGEAIADQCGAEFERCVVDLNTIHEFNCRSESYDYGDIYAELDLLQDAYLDDDATFRYVDKLVYRSPLADEKKQMHAIFISYGEDLLEVETWVDSVDTKITVMREENVSIISRHRICIHDEYVFFSKYVVEELESRGYRTSIADLSTFPYLAHEWTPCPDDEWEYVEYIDIYW